MDASGAYAKCQDCGVDLADRDALNAHTKATMAPTGEAGITARSHRVQVINPTEDEMRASRVRSAIDRALDDLYTELDERVRRGDFSEEQVTEQIRWFDLTDGWDEYASMTAVRPFSR